MPARPQCKGFGGAVAEDGDDGPILQQQITEAFFEVGGQYRRNV
ncbi:hypothetical protein [Streptomyces sp. NPDC087437]